MKWDQQLNALKYRCYETQKLYDRRKHDLLSHHHYAIMEYHCKMKQMNIALNF